MSATTRRHWRLVTSTAMGWSIWQRLSTKRGGLRYFQEMATEASDPLQCSTQDLRRLISLSPSSTETADWTSLRQMQTRPLFQSSLAMAQAGLAPRFPLPQTQIQTTSRQQT